MSKKDIHNLPKEEGKQLDLKKVLIVFAGIVVVIVFSFVGVFNKNETDEEAKKDIETARRIEESENIANREQYAIQEALESNPIIAEKETIQENAELEKLRLQREIELERMRMELEKEKLELERQRREAQLFIMSNSKSNETKTVKEENPYDKIEIPPIPPLPEPDDNLQKKKKEFLNENFSDEFVLQKRLEEAVGEYEVKAGTVIPLTLETAINSDLPGAITAVVKSDIYDSKTGNTLLIPAGSRVIGRYSSDVSFGQERVQAVFNRITLPNQESINIGNMLLVDLMGATGVKDKVDTKLDKVFTSVLMSAILGVGAGAVKEDNDETTDEWKNDAINGGGTQAINVGNTYAQKVLNVQPTLSIRNGYTVGMWVGKDLVLKPYKW